MRRFHALVWLAPVLALCLTAPGFAQAPAAPPQIPPVTVEGVRVPADRTRTEQEAREELQRVPGGTAVVGEQAIGESRAANLKDALDFVPGVMIRPRFGAADESQLSIRGSGLRNNFHLRGVNVLIEGFAYGQADGFADFESLELLTTKRIEVYKGANALALGGYTLGGAVNLVTKTGADAGLAEVRTEFGSFGFYKNYIGTGQVYGPLDFYAAVADTELDGFREYSSVYTWSRFVFVDDSTFGDNRLPGAPEHFVRAELRYDHTCGFWIAPGIEIVPRSYFVTSDNDARTDAYTLFNVRMGFTYKPWNLEVYFEGRNLTNATYASSVVVDAANKRFFEPGDGRAFYGGVAWRWN